LLQTTGGKFHEPFYVLVVEKTDDDGAMMHVWRLVLASEGEGFAGEKKLLLRYSRSNLVLLDFG
jgi:hypothetical protein